MIAYEHKEEYEVDLVKLPAQGYYEVTAPKGRIVREREAAFNASKSFHLDTYCFDSRPEQSFFWDMLRDGRIRKVYFTGMLTHGQSDFYVQYIDPESHTIRSYYPDFLVEKDNGEYLIVEVKGDNKVDDPVVLAKQEFADQMAVASNMRYVFMPQSQVETKNYGEVWLTESQHKQRRRLVRQQRTITDPMV